MSKGILLICIFYRNRSRSSKNTLATERSACRHHRKRNVRSSCPCSCAVATLRISPDACRGTENRADAVSDHDDAGEAAETPEGANKHAEETGPGNTRTEAGRDTAEVVVGSPDGDISEAGEEHPGEESAERTARGVPETQGTPRGQAATAESVSVERILSSATSPTGAFSSRFFPCTYSGPPHPSVPKAYRVSRGGAWTRRGSGKGGRRGSRFARWPAPGCGANAP